MKSDEAIEQIAYLKELTRGVREQAAECYLLLIIWGVIYIPGYIVSNLTLWVILLIIGFILTFVFYLNIYNRNDSDNWLTPPLLKRIISLAMIFLISGTIILLALMKHRLYHEVNAFWPFYAGIFMMTIGTSVLASFPVKAGLWFALVSGVSVFIPFPYQTIWLAITTGGGAVVAGLILRAKMEKAG